MKIKKYFKMNNSKLFKTAEKLNNCGKIKLFVKK
tara:strand:- start:123 stop:224 length:102 start_codon:yes stop_codon:yes gene_type:complete